MERLVQVARNLFIQKLDQPDGKANGDGVLLAELVIVTMDQEYQPSFTKPLIEGGQPQFAIVKRPVAKTYRFSADPGALQMLHEAVSNILVECGLLSDEPEETGPPIAGSNVIQMP